MKFIFWHHSSVQGPISLADLWEATHGFAASVRRLRISFWLAARGHAVILAGNVRDGELRGVHAVTGSALVESGLDDIPESERPVVVMLVPPEEAIWQRLPKSVRRRTIYWANNPFNPIWIERARQGELLRVACISEYHRDAYRIYRGFENVELAFHGIDLDLIAAARPNPQAEGSVLFCSVPRRTKGFHRMLRAWPYVRELVPTARLRVCGSAHSHDASARLGRTGILDYELEQEFPDFFSNPPESNRRFGVELLGKLTAASMFGEMKSAAVAVVNCNWRGSLELSCCAAVEAQSAGTPVVGPARGGLPELIIDGRTGSLVHRDDPRLLAETVARMVTDPGLRSRLGAAGPAWVRPIADYDVVVPAWEAVVSRALKGEPAPQPSRWRHDVLRRLGYGWTRAWARDRVRGTELERLVMRYVARG
jgi:glycosyltransferase involved in cell wall biosynthesis